MKAYVITIMSMPKSVELAERCIESAAKYGVTVEKHPAFIPSEETDAYAREYSILRKGFSERFSRIDNCIAAFCSHHSLWRKALTEDDVLILEHDAVFKAPIPTSPFRRLISYGKPSYGRFNPPDLMGVNPLFSKPYLPGAHAYRLNRYGAGSLLDKVLLHACPTDLYISVDNFSFIQEYHPWPIEVDDSFSTIQNNDGCMAKHNEVVPIGVE